MYPQSTQPEGRQGFLKEAAGGLKTVLFLASIAPLFLHYLPLLFLMKTCCDLLPLQSLSRREEYTVEGALLQALWPKRAQRLLGPVGHQNS